LSAELGYSLIVRTNCWTCGSFIYLLAKPDGGFVILDDIGPDWPTHPCYRPTTKHQSWETYHPTYQLPIPRNVKVKNSLIEGQNICATIVEVKGLKSTLCDGRYLYKLQLRGPGRLGECVEGTIIRIGSQFVLQINRLIEYPDK